MGIYWEFFPIGSTKPLRIAQYIPTLGLSEGSNEKKHVFLQPHFYNVGRP